MKSKFLDWFIAQHGRREKNAPASVTDKDLQDKINEGLAAADELKRRTLWDEKHESALYAWQVKDADK